jgi:CubicO group peptidase (beta-lactamase class C family)
MKNYFLAAALLIGMTCAAQRSPLPAFVRDSLDTYVTRAMARWQIPGVSVAIVKNGQTVWLKGYGLQEAGTERPVDENTLFMIGSNTKAFTATALAMLEADHKLSLDDKVQRWLPDFKMYDGWVAKEAVIRDLLCHRMGFETFQGDFMFFNSNLTVAEVRDKMGRQQPLHGFRSKWGYCNAAFLTAGEIIPRAAGMSWAGFLQQRIFKPLGMQRTLALSAQLDTATNRAAAHTVVLGRLQKIPYGHIDNLAPAGSISSSAADMSRWVQLQLNNGRLNGQVIVPEAALEQTRLPHSIMGNGSHLYNKGHFMLYGLGWMLEDYNNVKIVSHTGGVNGFVTSVTLIPEEKLGIVVLTNTDANSFYEALKWEITDAFLKLPYRNYSDIYFEGYAAEEKQIQHQYKALQDSVALKPAAALPLGAYTGAYRHGVYGNMDITLKNNRLIMHFEHHKGVEGLLEPLGGHRFLCTYSDPMMGIKKLAFTAAGNRVQGITVKVAGNLEYLPYEFKKVK